MVYEKIYVLTILLLSLVGLFLFIFSSQSSTERLKGFFRSWVSSRASQVFCVLTIVIFGLCAVRVFMEAPDVRGDFTLETIRTTLATDTIYQYNSLTGQKIAEGMPIRQQILTLPFFLAFLNDVFKVDAELLVYRIFPCVVLFWTVLVYSRWASFLFSKQREKESGFLFLIGVLLFVGDYAAMTPAALLLHQGFTGNALCAGVVIPYAMYLCLKGKWITAFWCVGAELFLIWTSYGLGYCVLVIGICAGLAVGASLWEKRTRRRKA